MDNILPGIITVLLIYFIPTITASVKKKKNLSSIAIVNTFLGWTIVGWIVSLAWAVSKDTETQTVIHNHVSEKDSVADKLEKLASLKEKGHITEDEYNTQKSKILN